MLHLVKLAVGIRDLAHLAERQAARAVSDPPLRHQTRMFPRRAEEIVAGGSIYWVVTGVVLVRQRIVEIRQEAWDDGTSCAGLILDPGLVQVEARPMRPFQGWRYLEPKDAPADLDTLDAGEAPEGLVRQLRELGAW